MGFNIKNESTLALNIEGTEGTYASPSASDYVRPLAEGASVNLERTTIDRDILSSTLEEEASRVGIKTANLEYSIEVLASSTEGDAPQDLDASLQALMGGRRQITSDQTSGTSHTSTTINFSDTSAFSVGDLVLVKESGAYEVRPVSAITTNTSITLAFALDNGAPSNNVVIAQLTNYYNDLGNAPSFSAEWTEGGNIQNQVRGCKMASASLNGWETGGVPSFQFSAQGLDMDKSVSGPAATPSFESTLPPVVLNACAWIKVGGTWTSVSYQSLSLSIENTVAGILDACDADGKIGQRHTKQVVTATINPYQDDTGVAKFSDYNDNDDTGLFAYAYNPTGTAGEFQNVFSLYIPQSKITEFLAGDQEGLLTDQITMKAHRSSGSDSLFMCFS